MSNKPYEGHGSCCTGIYCPTCNPTIHTTRRGLEQALSEAGYKAGDIDRLVEMLKPPRDVGLFVDKGFDQQLSINNARGG